jgi:hypothetical protein
MTGSGKVGFPGWLYYVLVAVALALAVWGDQLFH